MNPLSSVSASQNGPASPAQSLPPSRLPSRPASPSHKAEFIGALDVGTTSTRFIIFDQFANIVSSYQVEFTQHYPEPGWHEHDPIDLLESVYDCIEGAVEEMEDLGYDRESVKALGITNQRETTLLWNKETGSPMCNAIVWDDSRTASEIHRYQRLLDDVGIEIIGSDLELKLEGLIEVDDDKGGGGSGGEGRKKKFLKGTQGIKELTGLPLSTYFSAVKLRWMIDAHPSIKKAHEEDKLCFGTVDSWLVYNLTGGIENGLHIQDVSNACRTLLTTLQTISWSPSLLAFFGLKESMLPEIRSSSEVYGTIFEGPLEGVPIAGIVGDQQAALVGQKCLAVGEAKATYGTGAFVLFNTGDEPIRSKHGLISTVAFQAGPNSKPVYALEGSVAVAGASIKWLRDQMHLIHKSSDVDDLVSQVSDTGGVYFVTAFAGLLAPYWDTEAGGLLIGISSYTTKAHIVRATLEAIAYQTRAILEAMRADSDTPLKKLRVDGGVTNSDHAMQIQADIGGFNIERPVMRESTALGSALLAGSAIGLFGWDISKPETLRKVNARAMGKFEPKLPEDQRERKWKGWKRAVERSKKWRQEEEKDEAITQKEIKEGLSSDYK
ncbi:glycerol kinase [Phaffia rhodozyma]|uniref:glycerol kinase n=1 Tax=Phaffia rhodozyma TaxID=264483 RepID=A0A0F7SFE8_PHARH|nr:glycerol kinase [Phaffia rhodozyma]